MLRAEEFARERVIEIAELRPMRPPRAGVASDFLAHAIGTPTRVLHASTATALPGQLFPSLRVSQVVQAADLAFAEHHALTLSPEVIWYVIVHEVAIHVCQHARRYADLLGRWDENPIRIQVDDNSLTGGPNDDWAHTVSLFEAPLREQVGSELPDILLPRLSTLHEDDRLAFLIAFMDAVRPYFQYRVRSYCGIPRVILRGTPADWATIGERLVRLAGLFPPLEAWLAGAAEIVETIHATACGATPEIQFWDSLYKHERQSGGPDISGWITAFFAHVRSPDGPVLRKDFGRSPRRGPWGPLHLDELPVHVSRVPFVWEVWGHERSMVFAAGVLGVDCGESLSPRLGWAVAEAHPH